MCFAFDHLLRVIFYGELTTMITFLKEVLRKTGLFWLEAQGQVTASWPRSGG